MWPRKNQGATSIEPSLPSVKPDKQPSRTKLVFIHMLEDVGGAVQEFRSARLRRTLRRNKAMADVARDEVSR